MFPIMERKTELLQVWCEPSLVAAVDDYRRALADAPNRAEAIRRILRDNLGDDERTKVQTG